MKPADNQENFGKCICGGCPLFSGCNREKAEKLFCARKKSICPMDNTKMCICGMCPVYAKNDLKGGYFCIKEMQ
jgi:hypothetical protein